MGLRFRIGPFTFGRTGTRLSLWSRGSAISIPFFKKKGRTFGKIGFGPFSWHFGGSRRKKADETQSQDKSAKGAWRNNPATERQKRFADDLGIRYPESVTRGELSDVISKVTGKQRK